MRITLIAATGLTPGFDALADDFGWHPTTDRESEALLEFAGRACYQSWHKPNPATADTDDYLRNVAAQRHWSVVEHATASFYLEDVSRSLTHELVRHRHFSFSQLSQRYVHPKNQQPVIPPLFEEHFVAANIIHRHFLDSVAAYNELVDIGGRDFGPQSRKQVREAARAVLPNCTPTSIVVSGNYRSWLEFVDKRDSPAADREIRRAAQVMHRELERVAPAIFGGEPDLGAEQAQPTHPEYANEMEIGQ